MAAFPSFLALITFFTISSTFLLCVRADIDSYFQSSKFESGGAGRWPSQHYKTTNVRGPILNFVRYEQACRDGLHTFIAPRGFDVYTAGPMILDQDGHLVWFQAMGQTYNMDMQMYKGEPFLTFWTGDDSIVGHGEGTYYLIDSAYKTRYEIRGANGLRGDLHEFHITIDDTAVYVVYDKVPADLTSVGGPKDGWLWDGTFQEVNIETGELIFEWRASQHLPLSGAYRGREGHGTSNADPWDFFHLNSVDKDEKGNFLVSSRYYHSLTYIDGRTGEIIWELGGKNNMFEDLSDGAATSISWQHHARFREGGKSITIFDNSSMGKGAPIHTSRGLWIEIDQEKMTAKVRGQYWNPTPISSQSQGSVQVLDNGNVLVDYGYNAAWTEFTPGGEPICEVHMGPQKDFDQGHIITYRAFKHHWVGRPTTPPAWLIPNKEKEIGYVSWMGATEVRTWVLEGSHAIESDGDAELGVFDFVTAIPKSGFETTITIPDNNTYPYLRIAGLDNAGNRLGASASAEIIVKVDANITTADGTVLRPSNYNDQNGKISRYIHFSVGFLVCAALMGLFWIPRAVFLRRRGQHSRLPNDSQSKRNWWDSLIFGPVNSDDDDNDKDVEDARSEMSELLAAHADDFELGKLSDSDTEDEYEEPHQNGKVDDSK